MRERPLTPRPLVIKLGGAAIDSAGDLDRLCASIATAHRTMAGGVVLVHGGGAAVDEQLGRLGLVSSRHQGIRITPAEHLDEIVAVLAGRVNKRLVGRLQRQKLAAVGLCLGDGHLTRTTLVDDLPVDPGRVGRIVDGDPSLVETLLARRFVPVVCSIGLDDEGEALNVNADDAAAGLASVLQASGLILLTDTPGVLDPGGRLLPELTPAAVETLIAGGTIRGGMIAKVRSAVRAAATAGCPVTIATWKDPASVCALGGTPPVGTRIVVTPTLVGAAS